MYRNTEKIIRRGISTGRNLSHSSILPEKIKEKLIFFLITSWDRFSRNITDAFLMIRTLKNLEITVQAIEQQTDLSIPENKAMLALFLAIPEIDNERRI